MAQKVLLVTGASRGIDAQIARRAASENWAVCINYANSEDRAQEVLEQIISTGGQAMIAQEDVGVEAQVEAMFARIDEQLGTVTGLVNNAGINGNSATVDELDAEVSLNLFRVNILDGFLCAKHVIRRMAKRCGGRGGPIVNISSAAAKHDRRLVPGTGGPGIRVNTLRPGATMTELSVEWAKENPKWLEWVMEQVPLQRPGEVTEVAEAALFLLSEKASYITGATLDVSGGWVNP